MDNNVIVELLSEILRRLKIVEMKIEVKNIGYASMTQLAYLREQRLEDYRKDYVRQNGISASPVGTTDLNSYDVCGHFGEDEID